MRAALLIAHGSRSTQSNEEVATLAGLIRQRSGLNWVQHAFLDVAKPDIAGGFEACVQKGASEVLVLLHFLNSGNHILKDIPQALQETSRRFPDVKVRVTPFIGSHARLADLYLEHIQQAVENRS